MLEVFVEVFVDSSFKPEKGIAGCAAVVMKGKEVLSYTTVCMAVPKPSDAELAAILLGYTHVKKLWPGHKSIIYSDSMTVVALCKERYPEINVKWIPREKNAYADAYAYAAREQQIEREELLCV